jgi:hypothetical protein
MESIVQLEVINFNTYKLQFTKTAVIHCVCFSYTKRAHPILTFYIKKPITMAELC